MKINIRCKRIAAGILAVASLGLVSTALAQVQMMPDRGAFEGTPIVVWGNTTLPGGTGYEFDFGDGTAVVTGSVNAASQSYIATTHTFATALAQEDFIVTLTVGTDTATAVVRVYDPTALTAAQLEEQQINNAIEDGLRYQYWSVDSRESRHDAGWQLASWYIGNHAFTSMAVLAFENHGYTLASGDIYSPVVQGGLNFVFQGLATQALTVEPAGDPCVGLTPGDCLGYRSNQWPYGYSTSIALLAIAGSQAPGEIVGPYGPGVGKSYLEVAQRIANTVAWGQADSGTYRGGWRYGLDDNWSDGSAIGWNVLGLLDAAAFGVTVPAFVKSELEHILAYTTNSSGSMGYTAASSIPNTAKTGIRLQALAFIGVPVDGTTSVGTVTPQASIDYIDTGWTMGSPSSCNWGAGYHPTGFPNLVQHWNCIYSTFNVFKGLKLYGVTTLPNVVRPDSDWHQEYQMYLVGIQAADGNFGQLIASGFPVQGDTALALLVLSPTALILPDPVKFATVGLKPFTAENLVDEDHTVTAHAEGACSPEPCVGAPVPGATVDFEVLTGPNAGATGSAVTNTDGDATFTYTGSGGTGTDTIQACIGTNICSNIVDKIWKPRVEVSVDKDYRYTSVCFEQDNDLDGLFNEDPVDFYPDGTPIDNDRDGSFNEDDVDCPDGTDLGGPLPYMNGSYIVEAVTNKKGNVTSYNPGQYYAVSTITPLEGVELLETLWISEEYGDCTEGDFPLSALNPKMGTGGGNVVIVAVGPDGVAWQIFDSTFPNVTVSDSIPAGGNGIPDDAEAYLVNVSEDTTILMYVKFGPGLKGLNFAGSDTCENVTTAWTEIDGEEVSDNATLMVIEK